MSALAVRPSSLAAGNRQRRAVSVTEQRLPVAAGGDDSRDDGLENVPERRLRVDRTEPRLVENRSHVVEAHGLRLGGPRSTRLPRRLRTGESGVPKGFPGHAQPVASVSLAAAPRRPRPRCPRGHETGRVVRDGVQRTGGREPQLAPRPHPVALAPEQFRPARMPSFSKPGSHRERKASSGISTAVKPAQSGTRSRMRSARLRSDQNGWARTPSAVSGTGWPASSRTLHTDRSRRTSSQKAAAWAALVLAAAWSHAFAHRPGSHLDRQGGRVVTLSAAGRQQGRAAGVRRPTIPWSSRPDQP